MGTGAGPGWDRGLGLAWGAPQGGASLLDEYSLVRSPPLHGATLGGTPTLSPPLCSPNGYLGNLKPPMQGKKARKPSTKGLACGGKEPKDLKARRKKSQIFRNQASLKRSPKVRRK